MNVTEETDGSTYQDRRAPTRMVRGASTAVGRKYAVPVVIVRVSAASFM